MTAGEAQRIEAALVISCMMFFHEAFDSGGQKISTLENIPLVILDDGRRCGFE